MFSFDAWLSYIEVSCLLATCYTVPRTFFSSFWRGFGQCKLEISKIMQNDVFIDVLVTLPRHYDGTLLHTV